MKKSYQINTDIYRSEVISQAILDFEDVADITFTDQTIEIDAESPEEANTVFLELGNYMIGLINE